MTNRAAPGDADDALSPQVFHILLSLTDRPRHGYGIILEVEERSDGAVRLGTGTLYSVIKRMRSLDWIEETDPPADEDDDPRRKYYRLTEAGRRATAGEAHRLQALVAQARAKDVLPGMAPS